MPSNALLRITRTPLSSLSSRPSLVQLRNVRYQAHDALFDQEDLEEAWKWHASFSRASLPKGHTSYSRSSGPGGQHVNKTESKATSVWPISELSNGLPKLVRAALRSSRYYTMRSDSITIQAQTERSRTANTEENHQKLAGELLRIYREKVPSATSKEKMKKHEAAEKTFNQKRLKGKKQQSLKKAARKRGGQHE